MGRAIQVGPLWAGLRDAAGGPLSGGKVYTYQAGTTTPDALYSARDKSALTTNPIILNSDGMATVYGDGVYKLDIFDQYDNPIATIDDLLFSVPDDGAIWGGTSTGSANAYSISPSPALTSMSNGQTATFLVNHSNTGAATLNTSSLGAIAIVGSDGAALSANDLTVDTLATVLYDTTTGTPRYLLSVTSSFSSISVAGTATIGTVDTVLVSNASDMVIGPTGGATILTIQSAGTEWFDIEADGGIIPKTDDVIDLGSSTKRFKTLYSHALNTSEGVTVGGNLAVTGTLTTPVFTTSITSAAGTVGTSGTPIVKSYISELDTPLIQRDGAITIAAKTGSDIAIATDADEPVTGAALLFDHSEKAIIPQGLTTIGTSSSPVPTVYAGAFTQGDITITGGKITNTAGGSYSFTSGSPSTTRSINYSAITVSSGSDSINLAELNAKLAGIYDILGTMWNDFFR